jgi:hypothetical protein
MGFADASRFAGIEDALVQEVLREYGELTRRHLQRYLPGGTEGIPVQLLADCRSAAVLRSSLCIAMARATGRIEDAAASAVRSS